jgi:hypothetical protein
MDTFVECDSFQPGVVVPQQEIHNPLPVDATFKEEILIFL